MFENVSLILEYRVYEHIQNLDKYVTSKSYMHCGFLTVTLQPHTQHYTVDTGLKY